MNVWRSWQKCYTAILGILMLTVVASGCGSAQSGAGSTNAAAAPNQVAEAAPVERVIKHGMGDTKVVGEPKKVAVLVGGWEDHLISLGIQPYAVQDPHPEPMIADLTKNAVKLGKVWEPNLETILQAEPDLIISISGVHGKIYGDLSQIAPTILIAPEQQQKGWRETLLYVGDIFGKRDLAQQKIADYDKKAAAAQEELKQRIGEKTVLFMRLLPKEIRIYGSTSPQGELLYKDLGLKAPAVLPEQNEAISMEKLPEINPDYIYFLDNGDGRIEEFKAHPVWKSLEAVKQNRVYSAQKEQWPYGGAYLARTKAVDYILQTLGK